MARMNIAEKRVPQDGRIKLRLVDAIGCSVYHSHVARRKHRHAGARQINLKFSVASECRGGLR